MRRNKTVDEYILHSPAEWQDSLIRLRAILQSTEMEETIKWGMPVYTVGGKNVAGMSAFKSYVGIWFYQGVFLEDKAGKLMNAQEGKTKAMRQWRFESPDEIDEALILSYLEEAIKNQRAGKEVKADRSKPLEIPPELESALEADAEAGAGFNQLTKGKQREYCEYISEAKRAETRQKRLEKIMPMIRERKGLNDRYR